MTYKVFLVEDEIVTREGIRDTVDWAAAGYQFCGEAPDGEIALPLNDPFRYATARAVRRCWQAGHRDAPAPRSGQL